MKIYLLVSSGLLIVPFLPGCGRQDIHVYDVPKQTAAAPHSPTERPSQDPIATQPPPEEIPHRSWNAPAGWREQPPGPMQDAKFLVAEGKATVTISIFQGATGGVLANVNRWRNQLGLTPVDEAGLAPLLTPLDLPETKANLVDMSGPKGRMVAAIVPRGTQTWFFKILGEETAVGPEKNTFIEFVRSTK